MSQSFIINLLGGTVWAQHPVDTFRGNGRHMPFATYARHCGGNCRWRRRRSSLTPHVLAETAKLDGFAYTHVATVHTCMQFVLPPVQEGECPFCPRPPGRNANSWLVAEARNSDKSQRCNPLEHIQCSAANLFLYTAQDTISLCAMAR